MLKFKNKNRLLILGIDKEVSGTFSDIDCEKVTKASKVVISFYEKK